MLFEKALLTDIMYRVKGLKFLLRVLIVFLSFFALFLNTPTNASASEWTEVVGNGAAGSPPVRWEHGTVWDSQSNRLLVFGGDGQFGLLNDLWQFTEGEGWQQLTTNGSPIAPSPRIFPGMVWDPIENRLLLFGGFRYSPAVWYNDLWQYTTSGGWQLLIPDGTPGSPDPRYGHSAVWDSQSNRLLIFGGDDKLIANVNENSFRHNDLWAYSTNQGWQQISANGASGAPPNRRYSAVVWDDNANRLLVFGGETLSGAYDPENNYSNDLWSYDTTNGWQLLIANGDSSSPTTRARMEGVWDSQSNRFLIYGGETLGTNGTTLVNELLQYSTSVGWLQLIPNGAAGSPPIRLEGAAVMDNSGGRMLFFGGAYETYYNDLWQYVPTPINQNPTDIEISSTDIAENSVLGTTIGSFSTTDPNVSDTHTYSFVTGTGDTDNSLFTIEGDTLKTNTQIDYETKQSYSIRVRSTDQGGLYVEESITITVMNLLDYNFSGFFQPVDNLPVLNLIKAGKQVHLKFSLAGNHGLAIMQGGYPKSQQITCDTSATISEFEETIAGPSGLKYDVLTDQYQYSWDTDSSWSGTCRQFILRLNNGFEQLANFKFK